MKTYTAKKEEIQRQWFVIDASSVPLGRLASMAAYILRGKHKPEYTPHIDTGDHVIVTNSEKVKITGKKLSDKFYYRHTGYPGGIRKKHLGLLMEESPEKVVKNAVRGMLPKNILGRNMLKKLKVYKGSEHPHAAQKPIPVDYDQKRMNLGMEDKEE